jgi:hypothetical protein
MGKKLDLTGKTFGDWFVQEYDGSSYWICKNIKTGETKRIHGFALRNKYNTNVEIKNKKEAVQDLKDKQFGEWTVKEFTGDAYSRWICQCRCGNVCKIPEYDLVNGKSTKCSNPIHKVKENYTNREFGDWKVIGYAGDSRWICRCKCGKQRNLTIQMLTRDNPVICKHTIEYNSITSVVLREFKEYTSSGKSDKIKDLLSTLIEYLGDNATLDNISKILETRSVVVQNILTKFSLEDRIVSSSSVVKFESAVKGFITDLSKSNNSRIEYKYTLETGKEQDTLDIYLPNNNLAIELVSAESNIYKKKGKNYYQDKVVKCESLGIHLILIFEYEWNNEISREKNKRYLRNILSNNSKIVYARLTDIKVISNTESKELLEENHLQGFVDARVVYGCYYKDELIGIMSFGVPRYDKSFDSEIIRLCWKDGYRVIGGASKLFKRFVRDFKPDSVVSYCDISKFSGKTYIDMGFLQEKSELTSPNYMWVNSETNDVLPRYRTMKHRLIQKGWGTEDETENEIMQRHNYFKVYNAGNRKYAWYKN